MKRKFIRALVVVLAAFALVASSTLTISGTILGYTPGEMLQESPVTIPTPRDQQAGYSSLFAASSKRTCFPEFNLMTAFPPIGSSTYHAGSVDLNRRFARGLMLLANYTWAHNIDDATNELFSSVVNPRRPFDWMNLAHEDITF